MTTYNYPPTSRYYGVETTTLEDADGRPIAYLRRRFVPPPERFALLTEHEVVEGERLDTITAKFMSDPELFWRVADANRGTRPEELTERPGRRLRITLPEGVPATTDA